jgi:hypothetical protein
VASALPDDPEVGGADEVAPLDELADDADDPVPDDPVPDEPVPGEPVPDEPEVACEVVASPELAAVVPLALAAR